MQRQNYFEETEHYFSEYELKDGLKREQVESERNVYHDPPKSADDPRLYNRIPPNKPPRSGWNDWPSNERDHSFSSLRPPPGSTWNRTVKSRSTRTLREEHHQPYFQSIDVSGRPTFTNPKEYYRHSPLSEATDVGRCCNAYGHCPALPRPHLYSPTPQQLASMTANHRTYDSRPHVYATKKHATSEQELNRAANLMGAQHTAGYSTESAQAHLPSSVLHTQQGFLEHTGASRLKYPVKIHVDLPVSSSSRPTVQIHGLNAPSPQTQRPSVNSARDSFAQPVRAGSPPPVIGTSEIENKDRGFTIRLDVSHFHPREIRLGLAKLAQAEPTQLSKPKPNGEQEAILTVEGEREEESGGQIVTRRFSRKYSIPEDIKQQSIRALINSDGILVIKGTRKTWKETEIDIQFEPPTDAESVETGETVRTITPPPPPSKPYKMFETEPMVEMGQRTIPAIIEPETEVHQLRAPAGGRGVQFAGDREEDEDELVGEGEEEPIHI